MWSRKNIKHTETHTYTHIRTWPTLCGLRKFTGTVRSPTIREYFYKESFAHYDCYVCFLCIRGPPPYVCKTIFYLDDCFCGDMWLAPTMRGHMIGSYIVGTLCICIWGTFCVWYIRSPVCCTLVNIRNLHSGSHKIHNMRYIFVVGPLIFTALPCRKIIFMALSVLKLTSRGYTILIPTNSRYFIFVGKNKTGFRKCKCGDAVFVPTVTTVPAVLVCIHIYVPTTIVM